MTVGSNPPEAPGLIAAAVYLRPASRVPAVSVLMELGMFVREYGCFGLPIDTTRAVDLVVVFADEEPDHVGTVSRSIAAGNVVTVVLPKGQSGSAFVRNGAFAALGEDVEPAILRRTLADAGLVARQRRSGQNRDRLSIKVFGGLEFRPGEPWLARDGNLTGLSPTEHGLLKALVTHRGTIVPKALLEQELSSAAVPASDGYLETVILRLRRKVQSLGGDPHRLASVRGAGYVLRG